MPRTKYPRIFITSDLHLTDRSTDTYRFDLFPWLEKRILSEEADYLFILGDVTDQKDNHSSALVNRVVSELRGIRDRTGVEVYVLKGNHDYTDEGEPFFRWLSEPGLQFISKPTTLRLSGKEFLFLPHTRRYIAEWKGQPIKKADFILAHQTFVGAVASNGMEMEHGIPRGVFNKAKEGCLVISGDIHVPQRIGRVEYCGAPYPITFGDSYSPRVLYFDGKKLKSIPRNTIRKATIDVPFDCEDFQEFFQQQNVSGGDQIKARIVIPQEHLESLSECRLAALDALKELGVVVSSVEARVVSTNRTVQKRRDEKSRHTDPSKVLRSYCKTFEIGQDAYRAGLEIIKGA